MVDPTSDVLADRYELGELIGAGGMARVVLAHDRRLDRRVAVKLVREDLVADPVSRERLLREARAAAGLQHPNVVAVHDAGEEDGRAYIVMEWVDGPTLADRLAAQGRLTIRETIAVGVAVLDALGAAHRRGLVHRDVKPANVLLPETGGPKLADFGIAKALDAATAGLTATGQVLGTPRYVAPEQVAGDPATPASDLYSLGAVLYECLAGRPPFDAESSLAVALAHQREPLPSLAVVAPDVPDGVARVVERALCKAPVDRYADAATMAADLRSAATSSGTAPLPTVGRPTEPLRDGSWLPSGSGGGPQWRRWLAAAGALAVIAAVLVWAGLPDRDPDREGAGGSDPEGTAADGQEAEPRDLGDLVAELAREPDAAGERGDELLEGLLEVRQEEDGDRAEAARELMKETSDWMTEGELESGTGREALELLAPIGVTSGPGAAAVGELFLEVARDRSAWGEKGGDLLGKLDDLLDEDPADRSEEAGKLRDEVTKWVEKSELDADRGRTAIEVLELLAAG